jgi:hypothetical protein
MRKAVSFFVLLFFFSLVFVGLSLSKDDDFGSAYDHVTGDYWEWYRDASGTKHMSGKNYKTGKTWKALTEPNGDTYALSKDGFNLQYKKGTGLKIRSKPSRSTLKIFRDKGLITQKEFKNIIIR